MVSSGSLFADAKLEREAAVVIAGVDAQQRRAPPARW